MRKLLAILLALFMLTALVACDDNGGEVSSGPEGSDPVSSEMETPESSESETPESSEPETPESSESETPESSESETSGTSGRHTTTTNKTTQNTTRRSTLTTTVTRTHTSNKTTTTRRLTSTTTVKKTDGSDKETTTTTKKDDPVEPPVQESWEKPVTINTAELYCPQSSSFDDEADAMRQDILNTKDTLKAASGCKTYYISYRGDDANDGLSPQTAWKTTTRLMMVGLFKAGDVVLFERGGVYRNVSIRTVNGVSYGAYGKGPKPQLLGSDKNYADKTLWQETKDKNVWKAEIPYTINPLISGIEDVGNIIFDYGKICASDGKKSTYNLKKDFDFYYNANDNCVYLYHSKGNPGGMYKSIEMALNKHIFSTGSTGNKNITIENLCIKYTGAHGISTADPVNFTVRGCEIGYIGGGWLSPTVRYGNGIEYYVGNECNNCVVEDCWIYQCYDAGYTNQGEGLQKNITVKNNLIEYCVYNIEIWTHKDASKEAMVNCTFSDNLLRFAGYCFGTNNRIGSSTVAVGNISCYSYVIPSKNVLITNNVFDCSLKWAVSIVYPNDAKGRGPTIKGNTWVQKPHENLNASLKSTVEREEVSAVIGHTLFDGTKIYNCSTLAEMKQSVAIFDSNPKNVILE